MYNFIFDVYLPTKIGASILPAFDRKFSELEHLLPLYAISGRCCVYFHNFDLHKKRITIALFFHWQSTDGDLFTQPTLFCYSANVNEQKPIDTINTQFVWLSGECNNAQLFTQCDTLEYSRAATRMRDSEREKSMLPGTSCTDDTSAHDMRRNLIHGNI